MVSVLDESPAYIGDTGLKFGGLSHDGLTNVLILTRHRITARAKHEGEVTCDVITTVADAVSHRLGPKSFGEVTLHKKKDGVSGVTNLILLVKTVKAGPIHSKFHNYAFVFSPP